MTAREEQELFRTIRSLRVEVEELKSMLTPHKPKDDIFLNTDQAMIELGVRRTKLFKMLESGELPFAVKIGRRWRFSKNAIAVYLSKAN